MPIQAPQWTEFLSCPICRNEFAVNLKPPISLGCGHTICKPCLTTLHRKQCPFDQTLLTIELEHLPINNALLQLVSQASAALTIVDGAPDDPPAPISVQKLSAVDQSCYTQSSTCIEELALYLKPFSHGNVVSFLSRPIQRKLVTLVNCQLVEDEGRLRALRTARSLGERTVTELILQHQNPQQLSANLWAAVRARGCQFLGPAMQEEVLKLVLLALEDGSALSRKVLVMFVVQRLEPHFPQASKTSIGHVVQLLYRASCFKVSKREGDSSLMQLKEEFRTYEALRREHDAQIVQIATEAGLRIAPDQWSALLYGDTGHKSHMQSIIDKLQTPQSFAQSVQELVIALQRTGDPANLTGLRWHLKHLATIDSTADNTVTEWQEVVSALNAVKFVVMGLVDFVQHYGNRKLQEPSVSIHNVKYKISMCRDLALRSTCPRGPNCTFAHSEDELDMYRAKNRKGIGRTPSASHSKDDLSIDTTGSGSVDSDCSPSTSQANSIVKSSPLSMIHNKSPNPQLECKPSSKIGGSNRNPYQQFKFDQKPPIKLPLAAYGHTINGVPLIQPPLMRNSPSFGPAAKGTTTNQPTQQTESFHMDADSMYLAKPHSTNFDYLTTNNANNQHGNPMVTLHDDNNRRAISKKMRSPQHQHQYQMPNTNFMSPINGANGGARSPMQSLGAAKNKDIMRTHLELRRLEILKDIKTMDMNKHLANNNQIGSLPNTAGLNKKLTMSSNTIGVSNYPKDYWDNPPYHMDSNPLQTQQPTPFGGSSAAQSGVSPTTAIRESFVRSDSILDDDYVPFDVPTTSSKYGPISRLPMFGKDNFGRSQHDTTSMDDWLQKHNFEPAPYLQQQQRSFAQCEHPVVGNFDATKYRGMPGAYEQSTSKIPFDLNVNDASSYHHHPVESHFGEKSSSTSSSLSPHTMPRDKQLLSIELQSIEDQLYEQNKVRVSSMFYDK